MKATLFQVAICILLAGVVRAQDSGYIIKWYSGKVPASNRRTWLDNQLQAASLPALTNDQVASLKLGWDSSVFDGCAGNFSAEAIEAFKNTGDVAYVEPDVQSNITILTTQTNAPWGLQRISQRNAISNGDPTKTNFVYTYDDSAGEGVDIYVLDTGVRITHVEFGGRATFATTFGSGAVGVDENGHGTHCAGIAASSLHGVAKQANIIAVKVMGDDGTGSGSDIISGIDFTVQAVVASSRPSVINLSVTTPASDAIDDAVSNAVSLGVHVVVAAGNENTDASLDSPARASTVITVGATDINDKRASFSNTGPAVDIWAPGVGIISLGITSDTAVRTLDGTSMATPFVTGLVAYFLALQGTMSPLEMKEQLRSVATNGAISGLTTNSTNVFAFNNATSNNVPVPGIALQQSILGSIDDLISAFGALASGVPAAGSR